MKNIHILPTDKPSRLYLGNNENFVFGMMQTSIQSRNDDFTNQNIYITSDEEIKEGDWFISLYSDSIQRELKLDWTLNKDAYKKIILTTDQDLIKDGVQAIDDEFLEWFVKNPTKEQQGYSEEDLECAWNSSDQNMRFQFSSSAYKGITFKQWLEKFKEEKQL